MNYIQTMHQLIEKCAEYNMPLCKAFDSVEIPAVLEAIEHHCVDLTYFNILKHIYQNHFIYYTSQKLRSF